MSMILVNYLLQTLHWVCSPIPECWQVMAELENKLLKELGIQIRDPCLLLSMPGGSAHSKTQYTKSEGPCGWPIVWKTKAQRKVLSWLCPNHMCSRRMSEQRSRESMSYQRAFNRAYAFEKPMFLFLSPREGDATPFQRYQTHIILDGPKVDNGIRTRADSQFPWWSCSHCGHFQTRWPLPKMIWEEMPMVRHLPTGAWKWEEGSLVS